MPSRARARACLIAWVAAGLASACDSRGSLPPGAGDVATPDATTSDASDASEGDGASDDGAGVGPDGAATFAPTPPTFVCTPGAPPTVSPLRPLTRVQYLQTLADLLTWALGDAAAADGVMAALEVPLAQIPRDDTRLEGAAPSLSQAHVEGHFETASAVAAALTRDDATMATVFGACATNADRDDDAACVDTFIARFGLHVLRRPPSADEVAFFRDEAFASATITRAALTDLVTVMLMAPPFVFHLELGGDETEAGGDVVALGPYALASRLSYHFWRSMPDEALFAAAADGSLAREDGYRAAVERVFADPKTARTMDAFFAEWLELDRLPQPADEVGTEPFDTFAGNDRPTPALQRHMAEEVLALARHHVWSADPAGGGLDDLFTNDQSFATTPDLAAIYDVPVWDGVSAPPAFPEGERAGLLTRAALLVSGTWHTLPIHKGITIRRRILCDALGTPPEGAQNETIDLPPPYTQRQYAEALTMREGTSCVSCHTWMNPLGFASEGYDALGRVRDEEMTWDEASGVVAWLPVDASSAPRIDRQDLRPAADMREVTARVLESGKPQACVARFYFRFTFGRLEDLDDGGDGCVLEQVRAGLFAGRPLREVLRDVALAPAFKLRHIGARDGDGGGDGEGAVP